MDKVRALDRLLGMGVTLLLALVVFYFASFASEAEVKDNRKNITVNKEKIEEQEIENTKTQNKLCALAILLTNKERAVKVCNLKG